MASNEDIKKNQRKTDAHLPERKCKRGKQPNQKLKSHLVLQFLLKYTDQDHVASAFDIIEFLEVNYGISSDRRSIYKDIEEANIIYWMMENETEIEEAREAIAADEYDEEKIIVYDKNKRGFYVQQRKYELSDVALLAECVYATKFISGADEKRLLEVISELVSDHQSKKILHETFTVGRVKTANKYVLNNISLINIAMSTEEGHIPQKISFAYLTHTIDNVEKMRTRKHKFLVSPYHLIINDGNYYLLAFDDYAKDMRTFRVDRMNDVRFVDEPREGKEEFAAMDMRTFTQRVFSMFGGERTSVRLRCINPLLDTMIDRFGTKGISYTKADDTHFRFTVEVDLSDQFFAWISGFGKKIKIETPDVAEKYVAFLKKITDIY